MSTYNNQLWAKMVTDWLMSAPHSPSDVPGKNSAQHNVVVPGNDRDAIASSQMQATAA
jgi:hypothetical protein